MIYVCSAWKITFPFCAISYLIILCKSEQYLLYFIFPMTPWVYWKSKPVNERGKSSRRNPRPNYKVCLFIYSECTRTIDVTKPSFGLLRKSFSCSLDICKFSLTSFPLRDQMHVIGTSCSLLAVSSRIKKNKTAFSLTRYSYRL